MFKPVIRTKNFTVKPLRGKLVPSQYRTVIRFGSTTPVEKIFKKGVMNGKKIIEINTVQAIQNSRSKLLMKDCFLKENVRQAEWWVVNKTGKKDTFLACSGDKKEIHITNLPYPILAKREFGFKGHGMHFFDSPDEFIPWLTKTNLTGYYFEKYYNYTKEYRLHCTEEGCFYTCRKMLKEDAKDRYYRNDSNCVWFLEENDKFDKPINWSDIEHDCVKALHATGLKIGAFDIKVQGNTDNKGHKRDNPNYIIIEVNSAPAFGDITMEKYIEKLNYLIKKYNGTT